MNDESMKIDISDHDGFKVVKLSGKIGWDKAYTLDKEINWLIADGAKQMVFDLNEVDFICSGAIGSILYNMNKFKDVGGGIYLISSNDYVNYVFKSSFGTLLEGVMFTSFDLFHAAVSSSE